MACTLVLPTILIVTLLVVPEVVAWQGNIHCQKISYFRFHPIQVRKKVPQQKTLFLLEWFRLASSRHK